MKIRKTNQPQRNKINQLTNSRNFQKQQLINQSAKIKFVIKGTHIRETLDNQTVELKVLMKHIFDEIKVFNSTGLLEEFSLKIYFIRMFQLSYQLRQFFFKNTIFSYHSQMLCQILMINFYFCSLSFQYPGLLLNYQNKYLLQETNQNYFQNKSQTISTYYQVSYFNSSQFLFLNQSINHHFQQISSPLLSIINQSILILYVIKIKYKKSINQINQILLNLHKINYKYKIKKQNKQINQSTIIKHQNKQQ
ncbi:transmembrane protein, putative (macronuclear) [Tetrahymena thermophila SB210]|uniref:Transmembrane protein, putative n=1 Tax=Tetrahymena thermophila (strain SB210) TaxID=312017 RepID=W7XGZ8_TETTS|nr:transmembrane protein, putative [Tetrahymena thermophila SB210]EWS76363.1 transmembrane protein, putative [Tetrahymena thermophila SB210]|eukprot:XP_012651147.1 transmembrane protein, putative [Tetrahymena thermophila SB210]